MSKEFPSEMPTPANDNSAIEGEKTRRDTYNEIGIFRDMVQASDLLAKDKNIFLGKIEKIMDALYERESSPSEALARIHTLADEYGFGSFFHTT